MARPHVTFSIYEVDTSLPSGMKRRLGVLFVLFDDVLTPRPIAFLESIAPWLMCSSLLEHPAVTDAAVVVGIELLQTALQLFLRPQSGADLVVSLHSGICDLLTETPVLVAETLVLFAQGEEPFTVISLFALLHTVLLSFGCPDVVRNMSLDVLFGDAILVNEGCVVVRVSSAVLMLVIVSGW